MTTTHDKTAGRIAKQHNTEYNKGQGPDIQTKGLAIEVESKNTVPDAGRQLQGFKKRVYVAGADAETTKRAVERFRNSTIGVMDQKGNILKPSTRGRSRRR